MVSFSRKLGAGELLYRFDMRTREVFYLYYNIILLLLYIIIILYGLGKLEGLASFSEESEV